MGANRVGRGRTSRSNRAIPQEQDAAFLRNVMPYFELRQQALELYSQGYTSREIRDIDPEIADEMLILEQGGNSLLNDYEVSPARLLKTFRQRAPHGRAKIQKRERQRQGADRQRA